MEQPKPPPPVYKHPLGLGVVALVLLVAGYHMTRYLPLTPREQEQADTLASLRDRADPELRERYDQIEGNTRRQPPLLWPGRGLMLVGAVLFVSAGVRMARQPAARPSSEAETPQERNGSA